MPLRAALRVPAQPREIAWQIGAPSFGAGTRDPSSGHREMLVNRMFFSGILRGFGQLGQTAAERFDGLPAGAGYSKRVSRRPFHVLRRLQRLATGCTDR